MAGDVRHSYSRQVKIKGNMVYKTFKGLSRGNYWPVLLSVMHDKEYSSPYLRFCREASKLCVLEFKGHNVPEVIGSDGNTKTITMNVIDGLINVRDVLEDRERTLGEKLTFLGDCGKYLKEMHENGYNHGNSFLHNFGLGNWEIYAFDFEYKPKPEMYPTREEEDMADVNEIMWSAVQLLATDLDKGNIAPVLDTIGSENAYGSLPKEFRNTPWIRFELVMDPLGPKRPDLYKALTEFKG